MSTSQGYRISILTIGLALFAAAQLSYNQRSSAIPTAIDEIRPGGDELRLRIADGYPAPEEYSLDGVRLGMTETEVRGVWGEVSRHDADANSRLTLWAEERGVTFPKRCELDRSGKVVVVSGAELFLRGTPLLVYQDPLTNGDVLGEAMEFSRYRIGGCMNFGLRRNRRAVGGVVIESWGMDGDLMVFDCEQDLGRKLTPKEAVLVERNCEKVMGVELTTLEAYENPPWTSRTEEPVE